MKIFGNTAPARELRTPAPPAIPDLPNLSVAARYRGSRIGGDFYEFVHLDDGRMLFVLLDIAGKREEALHIAASLQELMHQHSRDMFAATDGNANLGLSELTHQLNRGVLAAAGGVRCAPAFVGIIDEKLGLLQYINAGHVPALLKDSTGVHQLEAVGIPLGLFSHATHDAQVAVMEPTAALLLVSKGVTEVRSGSTEMGLDPIATVLGSKHWDSADELCREALAQTTRFTENTHWGPSLYIPGFRSANEPNDTTAVALVRAAKRMIAAA